MSTAWKTLSRRRLLQAATLNAVAAACLGLPASALAAVKALLPAGKQPRDFIEHNAQPLALETARNAYGQGPITPISQFFVRNNLPMPQQSFVNSRPSWRLSVEGVKASGVITLDDLKTLPTTTVACVIQCSGNGRVFFEHAPSGSPWGVGAAGCALWTGVRVSDVFDQFGGISPDARFLTATGGEPLPAGIDPSTVAVERSVPIAKGLNDCLLVWEMNGEPLPLVHGGPVRLLVPGYFGVNQVKWVQRIAATSDESDRKIQQSGYRMRAVGKSGNKSHPSMYRMPVKSWINGLGDKNDITRPGKHQLFGVAFSGERGIDHVDISLDGGKGWQRAQLYGPDLGPNAWRTFQLEVDLPAGDYYLVSRATDKLGERQPRYFPANQRGYGHNGWFDHGLTVVVSKTLASAGASPVALGERGTAVATEITGRKHDAADDENTLRNRLFVETTNPPCGVCHTLEAARTRGVVGPNLDELRPNAHRIRAALAQGVGAMPSYAEQLTASEIEALVEFITLSAGK